MNIALPSALAFAGLLLVLPALALADDRAPTAAESAVIANYKSVVDGAIDRMTAKGWTESAIARIDIAPDVQVYDGNDTPFVFYGDIARSYQSGDSAEAQMQTLSAKLQTATTVKAQQAIIAQIQALAAQANSTPPAAFWITTTHNVPTFALGGDNAQPIAAPKGVASAFTVTPMHVQGGKGYLLEFGEDGRMQEDAANGVWRYVYAHTGDGLPHVENIEVRIEGDPAFLDNLLKDFDWTAINAALK